MKGFMLRKKFVIQVGVSVCLSWAVWIQLDGREVANVFQDLKWQWVVSGFAVIWTTLLLHTWRWQKLMHAQGVQVSFRRLYSQYMNGYFRSHVLPFSQGGDQYRATSA